MMTIEIVESLKRWIVVLVIIMVVLAGCGVRHGDRVLIPKGYEGWVVIRYGIPDAKALERRDGKVLIPIPESGKLSTSSDLVFGYGVDDYLFDPGGTPIRISDSSNCKA